MKWFTLQQISVLCIVFFSFWINYTIFTLLLFAAAYLVGNNLPAIFAYFMRLIRK
jgi:hypothetical protein